jgi:hypothetical protein
MELDACEKLKEAIGAVEKCVRELEEMQAIGKSKSALHEKVVDSAMGGSAESETAGKQILGFEKVLESMQERLEREMGELGKTMGELKEHYRQKAESAGIGIIAEAVPE